MRKLMSIILAISILLGAMPFGVLSKDFKIGVVNFLEVYNTYQKTKDYEGMLDKEREKEEKKLNAKRDEIEKWQSKINLLKDDEKKKEQAKITQAVKEYKEIEWQVFTDLKKKRDEKRSEIIGDIEGVIGEYAKKNAFDMILQETALLYGGDNMSITEDIVKIINSKYKK